MQWQAPDDCQRDAEVRAQVERLLRRSLDEVESMRFTVTVSRVHEAQWRVQVDSELPEGRTGTREIVGGSCEEVSDAAAVAIAMTVSESLGEPVEEDPEPPPASPPTEALAAPAATTDAPAQPAEPSTDAGPSPWTARVGLGVALDAGLLPAPVLGAQLALQGDYRALGLRAYGALFGSARQEGPGGVGAGDFELWVLGGQVCGEQPLAPWRFAGCAGAEAARVSGEGAGADVLISHSRSEWVPALRADAAVGLSPTPALTAWLRLGAAIPLTRPEFVFGSGAQVHRLPSLGARGLLELELRL